MTQQLTITDQVKDIEVKSGVQFELDITQVTSLAERGRAITSVNDENFVEVKREMQKTRKYVTGYFKEARDEFNKKAKSIIQIQNAVLDEFTPEEDRLIALDKAEKERVLKEKRLEALPAKRERITEAGIEFTDEEILEMDDAAFELEYATRLSAKLEADRIADEERRAAEAAALAEKEAELKRKEAEAERIEQARKEEQERAEERLRLEKEKAEREKREAEEAEAKRLADERFQAFLKENNYNEETDFISGDSDGNQRLCRVIAVFKSQ